MSLTDPSSRRMLPVRLTDIDLQVRYRAARQQARLTADPDEQRALLAAAVKPSRTVYWVTPEAGPLLRSIAA